MMSGSEETNLKAPRLLSIDALRGLITVFMALDHASYFIAQKHSSGEHWGGEFPTYSDAFTFLTRFVTHFTAPGFFFLMGVGMYLFAHSRRHRGWSEWAIIRHFIIRGGLLIILQLLIVNRAWEMGPYPFPSVYIGVLIALGGGMILGSFLLQIKPTILIALATILFLGTELLHPDPSQWGLDDLSGLLLFYSSGDINLWSNYPILPWLELVVFGLAFGHWLVEDKEQAFKRATWLGVLFLLTFIVIRALNGFGNIRPRLGDSWIDFLNVVKYPPSMSFTLMTTGVNLLMLSTFNWVSEKSSLILQPLAVIGRVPLFFYITHLFLYAGLGLWLTPDGTNIGTMYPYWLLGLLILLPLCLLFSRYKHQQPANSLIRFL